MKSGNPRNLCVRMSLSLVILMGSVYLHAQLGQPAITSNTSGTTWTPDGVSIDALVATATTPGGTDMCTRIQYVYNNLLSSVSSVIVDARGFTGTSWSCSVNPFTVTGSTTNLVNKHGRLLLGNVDIPAAATWVIPTRMAVEGIGTGGASGSSSAFNTIIHAASGLTGAVLQMGLAGTSSSHAQPSFGVQIQSLTVDCAGVSGCVGVLNSNAEEGSFLHDVTIFNAPAIGLHVTVNNPYSTGYGAVNSGPYVNVNVQYTSSCTGCTSSIPVQFDGVEGSGTEGRSIRGIDNLTVSGNNLSSNIPVGIYIFGTSTTITNSHIEYCTTGIQIGQTSGGTVYSTYDVELVNITVSNNSGGWDVVIGSSGGTYPAGNVIVEGLNHESVNTHTLDDLVTGNTVPDTYLGWYFLGTGSSTTAAVFSSSSSIGWQAPQNLNVAGTLSKHAGMFKIDHPLDPEHEYLDHSFVESPDMMNIYNGSVTTDRRGMAVVILPDYFEALNRDFRYQLTPVGQFAQAFVAQKVKGNRFVIKTNKPGVEVSWQVTGIRHDSYANQHRIPVEETKPPSLRH